MPLVLPLLAALGLQTPAAPTQEPEPFLKTLARQVTLGGQVRFRFEQRDPIAYADVAATPPDEMTTDQDVTLTRIRLHLRISLHDAIEIFIQPQDQRTWGDEASVLSDETNLDLHQGYVEVGNLLTEGLSLKVGRQELSYGDQRLVSPLDWSNVGRAWDAAKLRYASGSWWAEAFFAVVREVLGADDDHDFWGVYASCAALADHEFDVYAFGRWFNDGTQAGDEAPPTPIFDRRDVTVGLRAKGKSCGFDYSAEGILQRGTVGTDDLRSWAVAATFGWIAPVAWTPRLGVELTHASGDDDPTDAVNRTFDPLYPFGHAYQGFADVFAFKNGTDIAFYFRVAPAEGFSFHVDVHLFRLAAERDAWYNAAGVPIRRDPTGATPREVGQELDVHAKLALGKHVQLWAGVSHFFAGPFVAGTPGTSADLTWVFVQAAVGF